MELNLRAFIRKIKEKKSQKKKIKSSDRKRGSDQKKTDRKGHENDLSSNRSVPLKKKNRKCQS